jgi:hypothetical protein
MRRRFPGLEITNELLSPTRQQPQPGATETANPLGLVWT